MFRSLFETTFTGGLRRVPCARLARRAFLTVAACASLAAPAAAQNEPDWLVPLEELLTSRVTSVARKDQLLQETSSAVYVITRDDIERSGMRTVPDVLRLVPGLHVAQIDANKWAIGSRGLNGRWSKYLQVMIDGRSIYTPYFAGVFWDAIDVPLEVIERIEVIRGPGATIWGANAVNGVINIITTGAVITGPETLVKAGTGLDAPSTGFVMHSNRAGDRVSYRLFAKMTDHPDFELPWGLGDARDGWARRSIGGSFKATVNSRDVLEGGVRGFSGVSRYVTTPVTSLSPWRAEPALIEAENGNWSASLQWTRQLARQGHLQAEVMTDEWRRVDEAYDHHRRSVDLRLQHRLASLGRHDLMWGTQYRFTRETSIGNVWTRFTPDRYDHNMASAFVQDEIVMLDHRLHVTLGTKVEHRGNLSWKLQPNGRALFNLTKNHTIWGSVSRAMRAPDRVETSSTVNSMGFPVIEGVIDGLVTIEGNPDAKPEWMTAYEVGYRMPLGSHVTVDVASFYNKYSDMLYLSWDGSIRMDGMVMVVPSVYRNLMEATTAGGEVVTVFAPTSRLKVTGAYSLFGIRPRFEAPALAEGYEMGGTPRHQVQLRSSLSVTDDVDVDVALFSASGLRTDYVQVPKYARVDARVAWRPASALELSAGVQNAFDARHIETGGATAGGMVSTIPRSVNAGLTVRF